MPWWVTLSGLLAIALGCVGMLLRWVYLANPMAHRRSTCRCGQCQFHRRLHNSRIDLLHTHQPGCGCKDCEFRRKSIAGMYRARKRIDEGR